MAEGVALRRSEAEFSNLARAAEENEVQVSVISKATTNSAYVMDREPVCKTLSEQSDSTIGYYKPPAYEDIDACADDGDNTNDPERELTEEEKMLQLLSDIARRCTNVNPLLRPTAKELMKLLKPYITQEMKADMDPECPEDSFDEDEEEEEQEDDMDPEEKAYLEKKRLKKEKKAQKKALKEEMKRRKREMKEQSSGQTDSSTLQQPLNNSAQTETSALPPN